MMGADNESSVNDNTAFKPAAHARPALVVSTVLALLAGPTILLDQIWTDLPWDLLYVFIVATSIQSVLLALWSLTPDRRADVGKILIADLVLTFFLLRIYTWLAAGSFPDREGWLEILRAPGAVLDPFFVIAVVLTSFAFFRTAGLTRLYSQLSLDRSELPVIEASIATRLPRGDVTPLYSDRLQILRRYYRDWAFGGGFLILCAALSTIDFSSAPQNQAWFLSLRSILRLGIRPEMLAALLVYFLGGFLLASEGRLAMLNARWTYDGVKIDWQLNSSWRRFSILIIVVTALLAAFLPIGSAVDLSGVLQAVGWIAIFILGAVIALFAVVYYLLYALLVVIRPGDDQVELSFDDVLPDMPQIVSQPSDTTSIILGSLVWLVIMSAVAISAIYIARNHDVRFKRRVLKDLWRRFVQWMLSQFRRVAVGISEIAKEIGSALASIEPPVSDTAAPWRFIRLSSLSAREKLRYFYLSTARKASGRGVPRADAATPLEYTRNLQAQWPEVSAEIEAMTATFLKARYSSQPIDEAEAEVVKPFWKKIGRAIRRRVS